MQVGSVIPYIGSIAIITHRPGAWSGTFRLETTAEDGNLTWCIYLLCLKGSYRERAGDMGNRFLSI